jgi:hypothetical protein
LAPKRSDPQARRAFFADVFNSKSAKAAFGEEVCKKLMRVMEQPVKGRTWFEVCIKDRRSAPPDTLEQIGDQLLAEMGGNADRYQYAWFLPVNLTSAKASTLRARASCRFWTNFLRKECFCTVSELVLQRALSEPSYLECTLVPRLYSTHSCSRTCVRRLCLHYNLI